MKGIIILLGIVFSLILFVDLVDACSCISDVSVEEAFQQSDVIFIGKVIKIDKPLLTISSSDPMDIQFTLSKSYKGDLEEIIQVQTALDSSSCGFPFSENTDYLVYANLVNGKYQTGLCSRNTDLENAQEDLIVLDNLGTRKPTVKNENSNNKLDLTQALVMALLLLVIALLVVAEIHIARWIKGKKKQRR